MFALLTTLSWLRVWTFHANIYDLGIFHQVLWNTARFHPFDSSLKHMSFLGDHFSPGLVLLAPLEWLPHPIEVLLAAQAGAVVVTAWCVFRLAERQLPDPRVARVIGLATLMYPALVAPALFDFHPEIFMAAALAAGLLALHEDRFGRASLCFAAVLLGKEDSALVLAPLGLVIAAERRTRWLGVGLTVLSLAWIIAVVFVVMPHFRPPDSGRPWFYFQRYSHLGQTPGEVAEFVLSHPLEALWRSFAFKKLITVAVLILGFGGAPLFGGRRVLAAVPFAAAHYLSSRTAQFSFATQYLVEIAPLMAYAAIAGAPRTFGRWPRATASVALLVGVLVGVVPRFFEPDYLPHPEDAALRRAVALVPVDAPVCATNRFGASLSGRRSFDFCVCFVSEIEQYRYYHWPVTSSATYQLFDLDDEDTTPDAARRITVLRAAGAEVLLAESPVFVLRATTEVLDRAALASADDPRVSDVRLSAHSKHR